jgi:uncharacterized protein YaiE (UPF0345 family)
MSQLQVTGEAKIRDIQGPVVANSGVVTALDGDASQYVRGDGTLADFPTSTGGGSSVSYYLNSSVSQGTIGGVAYRQLGKTPIAGAGTDITISANGYIASYLTDANDPALLEVPAGNFNCEFYFSVNSDAHNPFVYAEVYKYDGTTFTLIGSSQSVPEYLTNGTTLSPYYFAIPVAQTVLAITDRIAIRIYVNVDGRTVTLHTENNHLCQVVTTFSKGLTSLNNLTRQVQFLATGTSGTDFGISSSVATHTFNLPIASATNTGKLSSTDWSTFNGKQASLSFTAPLVNSSNTISIPVATSTVDGYLDNADWVTFNSKQNAITLTTTGTSGVATLVGATLNIPNYTTDLSGYLPLTGGTLTGALNGTSASFSGNITSNLSLLVNRFSNGDYLALKIENRPITAGNNGSGFIAFYSNSGDATTDTFTTGKIYGKFDTNSYNSARLTLATVTGNEIYQDVLTAKDTNVGIGTINPAETLDLYTTSATANGVGTAIQIQSAGTGANQGWVGVNKGTGNGLTFSVQNNSIIFNTDASTKFGGTERFRINSTDAVFTNPLSVITNDNNFAFNVQLRNNNTGTQALTGLGLSDSSNVRKGQVLWVPSNYVTASLRNSFLVSSVTNVPLILCADATGADTPNIKFQSGAQDKMVMIGSSGNFGIGTSSPKERFEIAGLTANIRLYGRSGVTQNQLSSNLYYDGTTWVRDNDSFGAVAIQLDSTSGNLIFNTTATTSGFPAERLRINSSGNVGIGITPSAWDNSVFRVIQIGSSIPAFLAGRTDSFANVQLGVNAFFDGSWKYVGNDFATRYFQTAGGHAWQIAPSGTAGNAITFTQAMTLDANGRLGIGTSSPSARLEVDGNPLSASFNSSTGVYTRYKYNGTNVGIIGTANQIIGGGSTTAFALGTESNDYMLFVTNNAERMRITSGGSVGIGTSTPSATLSVVGNATFSSSVTAGGTGNIGLILRQGTATDRFKLFVGSGSPYIADDNYISSNNTDLHFLAGGSGTTEIVTFKLGGNVGIGTSSPDSLLEVSKTNGIITQRGGIGWSIYRSYGGDGSTANLVEFQIRNRVDGSNMVSIGNFSNHDLTFRTNNTERMRITSGGNVLIGQTTASGSTNGMYFRVGIESGFIVTNDNALQLSRYSSNGDIETFFRDGTKVGSISVTTTLTSYNVTSDYRLKQDFKDYNALDLVSKIKTYDYQWKVDSSRMYGVVAHELAEVIPYAVKGEKNAEEMQQVDYSKLVPILVKAIQELKLEIEQLKNK